MIINIDISIADSSGTVLHHFENRIDEQDARTEKKVSIPADELDFENFLAEYLSCSGFTVREKLIGENSYSESVQNSTLEDGGTILSTNRNSFYHMENSELEYKIRIGDKKVLIGKIPLKLPLVHHEEEPCTESKGANAPLLTSGNQNSLDTILNYTMIKAIEKYEANLYPSWVEYDEGSSDYVLEQ